MNCVDCGIELQNPWIVGGDMFMKSDNDGIRFNYNYALCRACVLLG
jgi:hypothetical protein